MQAFRIASESREGLRALGTGGQTVILSYQQLEHDLKRHLSVEHAALLAEPNVSPGTIDWFTTSVSGSGARRLVDLPAAEQQPVLARLGRLVDEIRNRATTLKTSSREGERLLGQMLELALEIPDPTHVYAVDDGRPVLTFWGHTTDSDVADRGVVARMVAAGAAAPEDGSAGEAHLPGPSRLAPPVQERPVVAPGASRAPDSVIIVRHRVDWRHPALWAAFVLALIAIGVLLLRACGLGLGPAVALLDYCPAMSDLAGLTEAQQRQVALEQELADLTTRAALKQQQCRIAPTPEPEPKPQAPPVVTPPPAPEPTPPDRLQLPTDKKDKSFLEGCWKSITGLVETHTKKPIDQTYCFDKNGSGTIEIGGSVSCHGHVRAQRSADGGLKIKGLDNPRCDDGSFFTINEVDCKQGDTQVECTGKPPDDSAPPYEVTIERQGSTEP